jgi:glutamine synthetase
MKSPRSKKAAPTLAAIRREFEARGIRQVKLGGFDIDGILRGKYISLDKFYSAAEGGLGFCDVVFGWDMADVLYDNAKVTGWHTGYPDQHATIDLSTLRYLPWEPGTAAFLLDFVTADGSPYAPSPRQLLQRAADKANAMSYAPLFSAEFEYFLFQETPESLREKGFSRLQPLSPGMFGYSWTRSSAHAELVHAIMDGCREFDLEVEGMHTETGPGVYESAIRYDDIRRSADKAALFKTVVKELCSRRGVTACFMAKWNASLPGCSGHLHQSLAGLSSGKSLFYDASAEHGMSKLMRYYLGGLVALMPELTALYWPTINSYKRSVENTWAPTTATWGVENRTTAIRVIPGGPKSTRIEYRQPGADVNPYLGMGVTWPPGYGASRTGWSPRPRWWATATPTPRRPPCRATWPRPPGCSRPARWPGRSWGLTSWTTTWPPGSGRCASTSGRSPPGSWSATWSWPEEPAQGMPQEIQVRMRDLSLGFSEPCLGILPLEMSDWIWLDWLCTEYWLKLWQPLQLLLKKPWA